MSLQKLDCPVAKWLGWSLLAVAIGLALSHLLEMRTLWMDEAMLALNYTNRGWFDLLRPLGMGQVAPIGYLYLSKAAFHLLPGYVGLRLVSFCAYLASIFFLWRGLQWGNWGSASGQTSPAPLITATFAATPILMRYSNEVKQYMFDALAWTVAFAALMALLHGAAQLKRRDHTFLLAAMGPALLWLSNTSVFVLAAWGATWIGHLITSKPDNATDQRTTWLRTLFIFGNWALFFVAYYAAFIHNHPAKEFMLEFWSAQNAFMPLSISEWLPWLLQSFEAMLQFSVKMSPSKWALIAVGLGLLWGAWSARHRLRSNWIPLFFILPPALHLLASALEMYPFHSRLAIWHVPGMVVMAGLALTLADQTRFRRHLSTSLLTLLTLAFLGINTQLPSDADDFSDSLQYLDNRPEANLIIHFSHNPSYRFHRRLWENLRERPFVTIGAWGGERLDEIPSLVEDLPEQAHYLGPLNGEWKPYKLPDAAFRAALDSNGFALEEVVSSDNVKLFRIVKQP